MRDFSLVTIVLCAACSATRPEKPTAAPCFTADVGGDDVNTVFGPIRGVERDGVRAFLGVPFAAPPVGELRFRAPQRPACFDCVFEAIAFGPSCVQQQPGPLVGSEDCLTLNVWAPVGAENAPVIFFLPAGDNISGGSSDTFDGVRVYDGEGMARAGVVVVTANYRLGALGFLDSAVLADVDGVHANYGLLDQAAALSWTQENIAAFGGDPGHVLLSGLSAGASDACALLTAPLAAGLFSAAWLFSGACDGVFDHASAETIGAAAIRLTGCDSAVDVAACMRSLDVATLAHLPADTAEMDWDPSIDGVVLESLPTAAIAAGRYFHVPLVLSTTAQEYSLLIDRFWSGPLENDDDYLAALAWIFGTAEGAALVKGQYPLDEYDTPRDALIAILTDMIFDCPTRTAARAATAGQNEPVRRVYYNYRYADPTYGAYGASHGFDVLLAFQSLEAVNPTEDELQLASDLTASLVTFSRSGTPGPIRNVELPVYDVTRDNRLALNLNPGVLDHLRDRQCDFWDSHL